MGESQIEEGYQKERIEKLEFKEELLKDFGSAQTLLRSLGSKGSLSKNSASIPIPGR
jgi:hypothetical protein